MLKHYFSCSGGIGADLTKKRTETRYVELQFFYLVGSAGHVMHSGASRE
jgi:hypothetical protein